MADYFKREAIWMLWPLIPGGLAILIISVSLMFGPHIAEIFNSVEKQPHIEENIKFRNIDTNSVIDANQSIKCALLKGIFKI